MKRFLSFIIIFALFASLGAFAVSADETESTTTTARDKWIQDYQEFNDGGFSAVCPYWNFVYYKDGSYYYSPIATFSFALKDSGDTPLSIVDTSDDEHSRIYIQDHNNNSLSGIYTFYDCEKGYSSDTFDYIVDGMPEFIAPVSGTVVDAYSYSYYYFGTYNFWASTWVLYNFKPGGLALQSSSLSSSEPIEKQGSKSFVDTYNTEVNLMAGGSVVPYSDSLSIRFHSSLNGHCLACFYPLVKFTPVSSYECDNMVGNDEAPIYYIDDSGDIEEFNIVFVDYKNMLVYCPVTNEYIEYKNISYDYDNFTYNFTTVNEENITLAFNEENITYDYGGNTYNYYYTVNNYNDNPSEPEEDDSDESDNGNIIEWLKKIYNAVRGIDTGNDIDVTINNLTNGEEDTDSFFKTFKLKLQWIRDVYEIAQMLLGGAAAQADAAYAYAAAVSEAESGEGSSDSVSNLATGAPSIYLNLGNANSHYGYDYGGSCVAIDFSWFAAYKPTVDSITGGFLWLLYLWGLVKNVPSIINGMGMTENRMSGMVAKFLDDDRK